MPRVFCDADGVLFNFDDRARGILGMDPREFEKINGSDEFWRRLEQGRDPSFNYSMYEYLGISVGFFMTLDLMPDAMDLWDGLRKYDPIILSGSPSQLGLNARLDKIQSFSFHFGEDVKCIVCKSSEKWKFAAPGDIIIDDWPKHRKKWENVDAHWIHHTSAEDSLKQLEMILDGSGHA